MSKKKSGIEWAKEIMEKARKRTEEETEQNVFRSVRLNLSPKAAEDFDKALKEAGAVEVNEYEKTIQEHEAEMEAMFKEGLKQPTRNVAGLNLDSLQEAAKEMLMPEARTVKVMKSDPSGNVTNEFMTYNDYVSTYVSGNPRVHWPSGLTGTPGPETSLDSTNTVTPGWNTGTPMINEATATDSAYLEMPEKSEPNEYGEERPPERVILQIDKYR